jgi:membrane protein required for colicin V production
LSIPDRILGAAFGFLRAVIVLLVMVTVMGLTPTAKSPWWQASRGVQWLSVVVDGLRPLLPQEVARWLPPAPKPAASPAP